MVCVSKRCTLVVEKAVVIFPPLCSIDIDNSFGTRSATNTIFSCIVLKINEMNSIRRAPFFAKAASRALRHSSTMAPRSRLQRKRDTSCSAQEEISKTRQHSSCAEDLLDDLCRKHMDLPAQDFAMGCGFLHQVALGVPTEEVDRLLSDVPSLVNFRDYDRRTPLHIASSEGHLEICKLLVKRGAKINRSDRWGLAPLDDAHRHQHLEVLQVSKMSRA